MSPRTDIIVQNNKIDNTEDEKIDIESKQYNDLLKIYEIAMIQVTDTMNGIKERINRMYGYTIIEKVYSRVKSKTSIMNKLKKKGISPTYKALVDNIDEAIEHINRFGSHHTDCIITENADNAHRFMQMVDSAGVYQNCSTRFADGFRYGFGAEVGISTGKIHARGPVGLEGLVTYKYKLFGNGHIVDDYATGKKMFHHNDV